MISIQTLSEYGNPKIYREKKDTVEGNKGQLCKCLNDVLKPKKDTYQRHL
jgi:hypothetical protein